MRNIKVIGVGGIGTNLLFSLSRHLNAQGNCRVTLIDGDEFEVKNEARQDFDKLGNKAKIKANELNQKFADRLTFRAIPEFVTKQNIGSLIEDGDVVFLAVDNHATRKLISDHCQTLPNIILISGGNELEDGNVQVYLRQAGKDVTRPLTAYHPEIMNPNDRSPGEMSCEERAALPGFEQILLANAGAAWLMYLAFWRFEKGKIDKLGEFYFDLNEATIVQMHERNANNE